MIILDNVVVTDEFLNAQFCCCLPKCKGWCCVAGDAGAPLEASEIEQIEDNLEAIKPYMRPEGIKVIEENDVYDYDETGELVTPLVNGEECAFVYFHEFKQRNAEMSFPVMCHEGDNTYYLNRNFDNEWSVYGAAYIEDYNSVDFSDTAVVVYGHNIRGGKWFGKFQVIYTDKEQFEQSRYIKLYLPDEERTYRVFAAVPHNNEHLLESYDFDSPKDYNRFINEAVSSRTVNGITDKDEIPETGTPLLILSSCLKGDSTHRFLVLAYQCQ